MVVLLLLSADFDDQASRFPEYIFENLIKQGLILKCRDGLYVLTEHGEKMEKALRNTACTTL